MRRALLLSIVFAGCAAPTPQPATTPPPPIRPENAAVATGIVRDAGGRAVERARVTAWSADAACGALGRPEVVVSGADGSYQVRVDRGVGPQFDGCIVLEAQAGGATARVQENVHYAPNSNAVSIDLHLPPAMPLTRAEADRLVSLVIAGLRNDHDAVTELALYVSRDVTETYALLSPFARSTRGVEAPPRLVTEAGRTFEYELTGRRPGTSFRVTVAQDSLTRIEIRE